MGGECLRRTNAKNRGGLKLLSRVSKALKNLQIVLRQIWRNLHGRDVSSEPLGDGLGAKGKATMIQGNSQQAHALSCPIHHVEKRTRHREGHYDGKDPKNEGQRSR